MSTECPACGAPGPRRAFTAGRIDWQRCRSCSTLFDPEPPEPAELEALYDGREYFVKEDGDEGGGTLWGYADDYLADRAESEAKFAGVLAHLERYAEPGRLADLGCGPGYLLAVAADRGWKARGADLNEWAVSFARDELGLDVVRGELAALALADGELDALTMLDLIEHVPEPDRLLTEAARVVRPGGAIAILTPDAGSPVSRMLGSRWPEVRRPGEHAIVYSVTGLAELLRRHGFAAAGWHSVGKTASLATLAADVRPAAPALAGRAAEALSGSSLGERVVEFDPRTKLCLYARRLPPERRPPDHAPVRVPRRPERLASVEGAIVDELESLAAATGFCDWMFEGFAGHVRGRVAEVGAGIGTFSERILARGPESLLLIEPDESCERRLAARFGEDPRVTIAGDTLPAAPALGDGEGFDLIVCQNVLEHVGEDEAALRRMAEALRPGGRLALVVPADPRLFGPLDDAYGHWRRYGADELEDLVIAAGLETEGLRHMNALGIPGWRLKNARPGARIGATSLRAYEAMLTLWRPLEDRLRPRRGLSLFCVARKR